MDEASTHDAVVSGTGCGADGGGSPERAEAESAAWHPRDGLGDTVAERWRRLRERLATPPPAHLRERVAPWQGRTAGMLELVEAAFAEPRLRALSPGTSVCWLRFSRRATPPLCFDLPLVRALGDDRFEVRTPDGRLRGAAGTAEAVAMVVGGLPADVAKASQAPPDRLRGSGRPIPGPGDVS
ncbi:hypothetical protein SAVIM338S_00592 [Streptomyces avidinii]